MQDLLLPLLILFAWAHAPTRIRASGCVLLLYLAGAREQPLAIARVLPQLGPWAGTLIWCLQGGLLTLPWLVTWQRRERCPARRALACLAALLLGLVPPAGLLGWLHPLTLSGWLFPNWGRWGLMATTVGLLCLAIPTLRWTLLLGTASVIANLLYHPASLPPDWVAIDTRLPRIGADLHNRLMRQTALMQRVKDQWAAAPALILLPEEIVGPWTAAEAFWWQPVLEATRARGITLVLGAQRPDPEGLRNGALIIEPSQERWQLARQPIPLAEWRPWDADSAPTGWVNRTFSDAAQSFGALPVFNSGSVRLAGRQVLFSFCYEDVLTLPMLVSAWQGPPPEIMLSMANLWWAATMNEPAVQRGTVEGWGRLWGVPVLRAVNQPGCADC